MTMIKREGLQESLVGDELLITDTAGAQLMVLNVSSLLVWSMCAEAEVEEIVELILEIHPGVSADVMTNDVRHALASFETTGLARPAAS